MRRVLLLVSALLLGCSHKVPEPGESDFKPAAPVPPDPGPAELQIVDDTVGTGKAAKAGDTVRVHYTGTLVNGRKFDSSRDHGAPFDFKIGVGAVIKGWDQGVVGMKAGGKRRLVIPEALGYGEAGSPPNIPPKAGLNEVRDRIAGGEPEGRIGRAARAARRTVRRPRCAARLRSREHRDAVAPGRAPGPAPAVARRARSSYHVRT